MKAEARKQGYDDRGWASALGNAGFNLSSFFLAGETAIGPILSKLGQLPKIGKGITVAAAVAGLAGAGDQLKNLVLELRKGKNADKTKILNDLGNVGLLAFGLKGLMPKKPSAPKPNLGAALTNEEILARIRRPSNPADLRKIVDEVNGLNSQLYAKMPQILRNAYRDGLSLFKALPDVKAALNKLNGFANTAKKGDLANVSKQTLAPSKAALAPSNSALRLLDAAGKALTISQIVDKVTTGALSHAQLIQASMSLRQINIIMEAAAKRHAEMTQVAIAKPVQSDFRNHYPKKGLPRSKNTNQPIFGSPIGKHPKQQPVRGLLAPVPSKLSNPTATLAEQRVNRPSLAPTKTKIPNVEPTQTRPITRERLKQSATDIRNNLDLAVKNKDFKSLERGLKALNKLKAIAFKQGHTDLASTLDILYKTYTAQRKAIAHVENYPRNNAGDAGKGNGEAGITAPENSAGKVSKAKKPKPDALDKKIKQWQKENPEDALLNAVYGVRNEDIKAKMVEFPGLTVKQAIDVLEGRAIKFENPADKFLLPAKFGGVVADKSGISVDGQIISNDPDNTKILKMLINANGKHVSLKTIGNEIFKEKMTSKNTYHIDGLRDDIENLIHNLGNKNIIETNDGGLSYRVSMHAPKGSGPVKPIHNDFDDDFYFDDFDDHDYSFLKSSSVAAPADSNITASFGKVSTDGYSINVNGKYVSVFPVNCEVLKILIEAKGKNVPLKDICNGYFADPDSYKNKEDLQYIKNSLQDIIRDLGEDNIVETTDNGRSYRVSDTAKNNFGRTGNLTLSVLKKNYGFDHKTAQKFTEELGKLPASDQKLLKDHLKIVAKGITHEEKGNLLKAILRAIQDPDTAPDMRIALNNNVAFDIKELGTNYGQFQYSLSDTDKKIIAIGRNYVRTIENDVERAANTLDKTLAHEIRHARFHTLAGDIYSANPEKYPPGKRPAAQQKAFAAEDLKVTLLNEVYAFRAGFNSDSKNPIRQLTYSATEKKLCAAFEGHYFGRITPAQIKKATDIIAKDYGYKEKVEKRSIELYKYFWKIK